ncbi:MAG: M4 family metallopeptidase [Actinomycetota bacterium]
MGPDLYGEALRSMKAPGSAFDNDLMGKDPQPAHMRDYFSGPADNRGVHINSGIPNRAFYLASTEIGTDKAAMIWYAALLKMWPTTRFRRRGRRDRGGRPAAHEGRQGAARVDADRERRV